MSWSKSFVIIGSTLLVLSMMSGMLVDHVINVRDGEFHGYWMECIESPVMQLESDNILSLYVLEIADGIRFVEDGTLENVTPVFKLENITRYSGVIELPSQGQYLVVVTTKSVNEANYELYIGRNIPDLRVMIVGLIFIIIGMSYYMLIDRELWKRSDKSGQIPFYKYL